MSPGKFPLGNDVGTSSVRIAAPEVAGKLVADASASANAHP